MGRYTYRETRKKTKQAYRNAFLAVFPESESAE